MATKSAAEKTSPEATLKALIAKFDADAQKLIRAVRTAVRKRVPTANELLYDYGTFFVITYSASDKPWHGVLTIAARPDGVRLYLSAGPKLPDPKKILLGSAKQVRYVPLESARRLAHPDVEALIAAAIALAPVPLENNPKSILIVKTDRTKKTPAKRKRKAK